MSLNFNLVILDGRLTDFPELKTTSNGVSFTSFRIAVDREYTSGETRETDFISIIAWRKTAEFITRYFKKGSAIHIVGSIQTRSWTDSEGKKRYATDVVADKANFVESKSTAEQNATPAAAPTAPAVQTTFEDVTDDDDLPF